jgi:putative mRNA 3-end processing factor
MLPILSDFLVRRPQGLYCPYGDFYLDPMHPVAHAVVSHAHGDHASPGHQHIYCTAPSQAFMNLRFSKHYRHQFHLYDYGETFHIGPVTIYFMSAGHILGSAQILMEYMGVRYLYTGDFKRQQDATCEPLCLEEADVMITETTFAQPDMHHPDPSMEMEKLNDTSHNILLGAYALGKAQRLTRLLQDHCPQKRILVHHTILPLHKIYQQFGVDLGAFDLYNRREMKNAPQHQVYIVPPMTFHAYKRAQQVVRVFASGWKKLQHQNDLSLYISDHIDWADLLYCISQIKPREIWTIHGDGRALQAYFKDQLPVRILD